jgi:hypothetical protein
MGHQSPSTEDIARMDGFEAALAVPGELYGAIEEPEHAVSGLTGAEDRIAWFNVDHLACAGKGAHGVEGVHSRESPTPISLTQAS